MRGLNSRVPGYMPGAEMCSVFKINVYRKKVPFNLVYEHVNRRVVYRQMKAFYAIDILPLGTG